ncbi:Rid family hydrolase [Yinghuangia aomiensis]
MLLRDGFDDEVGVAAVYDQWHIAPGVRVGDLLICSGVTGVAEDGSYSSDPVRQYEQVFANIEIVLAAAGAGLGDIVEMLTFHVDFDKRV